MTPWLQVRCATAVPRRHFWSPGNFLLSLPRPLCSLHVFGPAFLSFVGSGRAVAAQVHIRINVASTASQHPT